MSWILSFCAPEEHQPMKDRHVDNDEEHHMTKEHAPTWQHNTSIPAEEDRKQLNLTPWLYALTGGAATIGAWRLRNRYFRRIPNVGYLLPHTLRKRTYFGYVTSVGDGDGFRLYHTPGGRLAGFTWLRKIPQKKQELKDQTLSVRIAGIDAPECAHFGNDGQPYGPEALAWLRSKLEGRFVRVLPHSKDQYQRIVATAWVRKWGIFKSDVGLEMLKNGLATVYEAKTGAEFGGKKDEYRAAETKAREKKLGMWQQPGIVDRVLFGKKEKRHVETPREYKSRTARPEDGK
ncbi:putative endonuclease lcl3 [Fulvia fulva]|uniref:Probable endonuclease LCL3 n=1 Tax=Passalora fulva TaxID=5499 RepID=A0A9Q8P6Q2_PASFU|nr:putative endonuclease lcl3 [Fulvia fulva]KAK4629122.1 putative endonuclease lcl3 [Fulvia fulva]KAK4630765.1 putative endonuclease lcl3 [Fulvia fulva]UJO15254.1 putative endonuclease lcl3 [Fulvia fulva]WPV12705.1 putative endonuclease lcl3 [Fulvia fulva]WPV27928.1 putative endonuclease lcl3 [Fulvia fulva]